MSVLRRRLDAVGCALVCGLLPGVTNCLAAPPAWPDYEVILWQDQPPARWPALRAMGVTAGKITGQRDGFDADRLRRAAAQIDAAYIVENIATDFYAAYHRWHPDHPPGWLFEAARQRHLAAPQDPAPFFREPSLLDPVWLDRIRTRLARHAAALVARPPLYYSLADEAGVADLASAWDFDLAPQAVVAFQDWLRAHYETLEALNAQWGTTLAAWDQAAPMTTDRAIREAGDNLSAWTDFKQFTDESFAAAIRAGTGALHAADPAARAALEGAQIPGWGGWNYTTLAGAADVMEMYDLGGNIEIARSLDPSLAVLTTSFGEGPAEAWRLWRALTLGSRGLVVWDEKDAFLTGPRGAGLEAAIADIRTVAPALLRARPAPAQVAVVYSPESFRVQWLLDRRADGTEWSRRDAETEGQDTPLRASMRTAWDSLLAAGLSARWVDEAGLRSEQLCGLQALLLPRVIALSPEAAAAVRAFAASGGLVLSDGPAGVFDSHGRLLPAPQLADLPPLPTGVALQTRLAQAAIRPALEVTGPDGRPAEGLAIRVFQDGPARLLTVQVASPPTTSDPPPALELRLPTAADVTDLRTGRTLRTDRAPFRVDPAAAAVLRITP